MRPLPPPLSVLSYIHAHTHTHSISHTRTLTYTHARTHIHTHTHARTHAHTHTHARTHTHTHIHPRTHTHTFNLSYTHTHTHACTHAHTHTHTRTSTRTRTHARTHTHTHTHTRARTHTHTHSHTRTHCHTVHSFHESMKKLTLLTPLRAISSSSSSLLSSTTQPLSPPHSLLDFPPLSTLTNALITVFNDLRQCAPLVLGPEIARELQRLLESVVHDVGEYHRYQHSLVPRLPSPGSWESGYETCTVTFTLRFGSLLEF